MEKTKVAVISDNVFLSREIIRIAVEQHLERDFQFEFFCSEISPLLKESIGRVVTPIALRKNPSVIAGTFPIVISAHCKQIFPEVLVQAARCANIHPGLNPHNRGWYPQVFSILNKKPWGATFHIIDNELDHGPIIAQIELQLDAWDTSLSAYQKVQKAEVELLEKYLEKFLKNDFTPTQVSTEGNLNLKRDFNNLLMLDLNQSGTLGQHIDLLRALTHGEYKNAHFFDEKSGRNVYVRIDLTPDEEK
jgi:methionyl-tRNA formyltransferase